MEHCHLFRSFPSNSFVRLLFSTRDDIGFFFGCGRLVGSFLYVVACLSSKNLEDDIWLIFPSMKWTYKMDELISYGDLRIVNLIVTH